MFLGYLWNWLISGPLEVVGKGPGHLAALLRLHSGPVEGDDHSCNRPGVEDTLVSQSA